MDIYKHSKVSMGSQQIQNRRHNTEEDQSHRTNTTFTNIYYKVIIIKTYGIDKWINEIEQRAQK